MIKRLFDLKKKKTLRLLSLWKDANDYIAMKHALHILG